MTDKIINVESPEHRAEIERRQHRRRREDQVRTLEQAADLLSRERRYALLQAAAVIHANQDVMKRAYGGDWWAPFQSVIEAETLLDIIEKHDREKRERERQGKETK